MPSTDIDGSPVLIIGREQAVIIANALVCLRTWRSTGDLTTAEQKLANQIKETFGIET